MKKLFPALLALVLFSISTNAQILWQKTYGSTNKDSYLNRMIPLQNGGYLLAGSQTSATTGAVAYIVRTNSNGDTVWTRCYLPAGFDNANIYDAAQDIDGNLVLVGGGTGIINTQDYNGFILKLNSYGDTIWTKRVITPQHDSFYNITIGNDSTYLISTYMAGSGYLLKVNKNGTIRWIKSYHFSPNDPTGTGAIIKAPNGYLVFVASASGLAKISRIDEQGNENSFSLNTIKSTSDVGRDFSGNIIGCTGVRLFKLNLQGDTLWNKFYRIGIQGISVKAAKPTSDGNYITAFDRRNGMDNDVGLMKTTINGDVIKDTVLFRSGDDEFVKSLVVDANGDYVFAGYASINSFNNHQMFLVKHRKWNQTLGIQEDKAFAANIKLYPNPATVQTLLESEKLLTGNLSLYNLQGQQLWQETVAHHTKKVVPLQNLPAGIYILRYTGEDGSQFSRKLIKR